MAKKSAATANKGAPADTEPTSTAELVPVLPGSAEVDSVLVDQAVEDLNRIYVGGHLENARALGEYIVAKFFAGDLDAVGKFGPSGERHQSYRALSVRDDLHVSHAHLWVCLRVLGQLRLLPEDIANALPISHHRRLLTVRDEDAKVALARTAVEKGLTVQALEAEVAKAKAKESKDKKRPGRKALPSFEKAVNALRSLNFGGDDLSDEVVASIGEERAGKLVETIDRQIAALKALRARVGKAGA